MSTRIFWFIVRVFTALMLSMGGLLASVSFVAAAPAAQTEKGAGVGFSNPVSVPVSTSTGVSIQGAAAPGSNVATGLEILKDRRGHGIVVTDGHNSAFQVEWSVKSDDGDSFGPYVSTIPANTMYTRMEPRLQFAKLADKHYGYISAKIVGGVEFGTTKVLWQAGVNPQWVTPTPTTVNGQPCFFFDWWTVDITIAHSFSWTDKAGVAHTQDGETITIDSPNGSHVSGVTKAMALPTTDDPTTEIVINTTSWKGNDPNARHVGSAGGFYNTCVQTPPPPTKESAECISLTPRYVALKPSETSLFTLTGSKVLTYSIELDGQQVSTTNTFNFVAGSETVTHTITGKVAGEDGVFNTAQACVATVVVSQTPPPPPTDDVVQCNALTPRTAVMMPGQDLEFVLTGTFAKFFQILMGDKVVSNTDRFIFHASDIGTFDLTGQVAGQDGQFVSGANCVARIVVMSTPTDKLRIEAINGLFCSAEYEPVAAFAYVGTWGGKASKARLIANNDSSTSMKARAIGRQTASKPLTANMDGVMYVNLNQSAVDWVQAPDLHTREVKWWRAEEPWYDTTGIYARVHGAMATLNLLVDGVPTVRQIAPVAMPSAEWLADPQNGCVRPTTPHNPDKQQISVCVGRKADGSKDYQLFDLGSEPAEAAVCQDTTPAKKNFCAKVNGVDTDVTLDADSEIPVHLPCTLGEVDEAEANTIIFAQDMGALNAGILPLLGLVMLTGMLAIRRRYAH